MRALLATLLLCVIAIPAHAGWISGDWLVEQPRVAHVRHTREGWTDKRYAVRDHETGFVVSVLSASCRIARALGGPCGCFASEYFFGRSVRELWLANAWLAFPRVAPAAGTAAVWPNRHVAAVIAAHRDGTVTVRDSWAVHRVRIVGVVFVNPRAGPPPMRARHARA
jgi:hypothetical protein